MDLDRIQLAIRPRTIFECLDVAFLFCGRHWLGVLLTSAVGVIPILVLDSWFKVSGSEDSDGYLFYLFVPLQIPWATSMLTLYLGQITFSQKFSPRRAIRDFFRSIIPLILFQVVLKGLCLAVVVLSPVAFVGMYYLNEVLLLERPGLARVWKRVNAMSSNAWGRLISLVVVDGLVLLAGVPLLATLIRAISSLWEDRFQWSPGEFADGVYNPDWQLSIAFWLVIVFLTVFRFITYLDGRIRREGWDVELKLKAQATLLAQREGA